MYLTSYMLFAAIVLIGLAARRRKSSARWTLREIKKKTKKDDRCPKNTGVEVAGRSVTWRLVGGVWYQGYNIAPRPSPFFSLPCSPSLSLPLSAKATVVFSHRCHRTSPSAWFQSDVI